MVTQTATKSQRQGSKAKIRPAAKWPGGKYYLAGWIAKKIHSIAEKDRHTYAEPYGGMATVLMSLDPFPVEVYNDINPRCFRFFKILREQPEEFKRLVELTPYSEAEFKLACTYKGATTDLEKARRDFVRWRMAIGGRDVGRAFSLSLHRTRGGICDNVNGYLSLIHKDLPRIVERFQRVQILQRDAEKVIQKFDSAKTVFYLDPPYLPSTRASGDLYEYEMTEEQHISLAKLLQNVKGKVVLSGNPSPLYSKLYKGWNTEVYPIANHLAGGEEKNRREEVLWMNF